MPMAQRPARIDTPLPTVAGAHAPHYLPSGNLQPASIDPTTCHLELARAPTPRPTPGGGPPPPSPNTNSRIFWVFWVLVWVVW